ncbi:MAG TPA: hypothetical protein VIU86_20040 [Gaiellaceae bacterium]
MAGDLIQFDGGVLVADMVQEGTVTDASDLTQYPIEDGSFIADHMVRQPQTLSLTLVQTETPIEETTGFARAVQALSYAVHTDGTQPGKAPIRQSEFRPAPLLALSGAVKSLLFGGGPDKEVKWTGLRANLPTTQQSLQVHVLAANAPVARVNAFHNALLNLMVTATPVIVTLKGASYTDLVLISVARTDSKGQVGSASFAVQLKQISTVTTKTVKLPPVPAAKAPKQQAKPPEETSDQQNKKIRSLMLQLGQGSGLQE